MSKDYKIKEENVKAAYEVADEPTKKVLNILLGRKEQEPTLDNYKSIKSYEDACKALGENPYLNELQECKFYSKDGACQTSLPKHIIASMKLETISRALWGRNWQPKPNGNNGERYWYCWFCLYTKAEVDEFSTEEKERGALLSAGANTGAHAGFGTLAAHHRSSYTAARIGFRLCQETEEKALYFATQFIELWADYLKFNFTTGKPLR